MMNCRIVGLFDCWVRVTVLTAVFLGGPTSVSAAANKAVAELHAAYDSVTTPTKASTRYGGYDELAEENTSEYRLAKCEEAIAKSPDDATRSFFRSRKVSLLVALRRYDEAMAFAKEMKSESLQATVCRARAARYYAPPDEKWTREAIAHELKAIEGREDNRNLRPVASDLIALQDYKGLLALQDLLKGKPDAWLGVRFGDACYETGDYPAAVSWYEKYPNFKPGEGFPNSYQRYAGALYALGRYEDCLKIVDKLPTVGTFKDTNAYYRHILAEKIAAQKQGK